MKLVRIIDESLKIPCDSSTIDASFNGDVSDEKYEPTHEFCKAVYEKMNKELFYNVLPSSNELKFSARDFGVDAFIACTSYEKVSGKKDVIPIGISLNSSYVMTLHQWMEAILHEMIHICDYLLNPGRFYDENYNTHGEWFMKKGKTFEKHGFHVTEVCEYDNIGHSDGDGGQEDSLDEPNVFALIGRDVDGVGQCVRIDASNLDGTFEKLHRGMGKKKIVLLKTRNPDSNDIEAWDVDGSLEVCVYDFTEAFQTQFGPFTEPEIIDLKSKFDVSESRHDEIDDYISIAKTIHGVVSVKKLGPKNCIVTIA